MSPDLIPMLLLSLLLATTGSGDVRTAELLLSGDHAVTSHTGLLVIGDATVSVPAGARLPGPVHVIGGRTRISGTVDGDVVHIAGSLLVDDDASIRGTLQRIGGTLTIAPGATVGHLTEVQVVPAPSHPAARLARIASVALLLGAVGARRARRRPGALDNVGSAITGHPAIALTVGGLVAVTFLSLFVFMAFTLVLLPVTVLGLATGVVAVAYGVVALGHRLGRRLPLRGTRLPTAAGVAGVVAALGVAGAVPLVGDLAVLGVLLAGLGAGVVTYLGLQEFTPASIPD